MYSTVVGRASRAFWPPTERLSVARLQTHAPRGGVENGLHLKIGKEVSARPKIVVGRASLYSI